jgi:tRNA dimethylallyltransferase
MTEVLDQEQLPPLVVILGPTAVGKTELSIQLAQRLNGEIVSADSRLFYRGLDIGTAKPTAEERAKIRHHLVNIADPDQVLSLAQFQALAKAAIAEILRRRRLPFLVGGTGQYIRAISHGWQAPQVRPDRHLRVALESWAEQIGADGLHKRLGVLDPVAARKIDYRNLRRTVRALEVIFTSGYRFSEQRRKGKPQYRTLLVGLNRPRSELYERIDARIDTMLAQGFVQEVRGLLDRGYSPHLPSLSAIGYRQIIAHLAGEITLDQAVIEMRRATRVFVRRQANWFKMDDPQIRWFAIGPNTVDAVEAIVLEWLYS